MKLKINNPRYSVEYNISRLVLDFLSLMSLTFFVYSLYVDKISIYILLRILMILLIIFIIRLLRKLIIHSLVCYMETLDEFTKFRI